jgi:hypothetical protein
MTKYMYRCWEAIDGMTRGNFDWFETTLLGPVFTTRSPVTGERRVVVPQWILNEAQKHGFRVLDACSERNVYILQRLKTPESSCSPALRRVTSPALSR